jgi:hypothetical protein
MKSSVWRRQMEHDSEPINVPLARVWKRGTRAGKTTWTNRAVARPWGGSAAVAWSCTKICQKGGVDSVNRFGIGLGRTSAGLTRIRYVFGSSQCLQGLECGSSPTSGTVFPQVRGLLTSGVWTKLDF